jgi:tetratricopeptide (TPR) repeat protein
VIRFSLPLSVLSTILLVLACVPLARAQALPRGTAKADPAVERRLVDAAKAHPDSFEAQRALGGFYLQTRRIAAAIPYLERASRIDPADAVNSHDLAVAYLETDKLDLARQQVTALLQRQETAELLNLLGDIDAQAGDRIAAATSYQRAAHADPSEEHLFDWGDNLLQLRAYADAADVFTAAIRRHPGAPRLHIGLGIAQYYRGQREEAVRSFCAAADLAPADPRPYGFLGEMYGVSPDQAGEITKRLARFVELRPKSAEGQYYYAMNLWKGGSGADAVPDLARIEALLRKAATLDPKYAKPRLQLGILLSEQKRWAEAVSFLKAAVALEPGQPQGHFRLAQAYRRSGQTALADEELATFKRLGATPQP